MKSWSEQGLRFHERYPWSHPAIATYSEFHEVAYILPALNRVVANNPDDKEAERRASGLVRAMRSLVIHRKRIADLTEDVTEPVYEFPNDVYFPDRGFDLTRHTGRGEQAIFNGAVLLPLVHRGELAGDDVALDLAVGLANHLLGMSGYFSYRMEFLGHVHCAVWIACGLVRLGRLISEKRYVLKGKAIYDYVRSLSSSFGWVPEYAQRQPLTEEHCETCCIKDMIECAMELIDCGYAEHGNDVNLFARNQLFENQIKEGCFVAVDNTLPDTEDTTYRDIDQRLVGGFSGKADPNSIVLSRFASVAGCCMSTGPQALQIVWERAIKCQRNRVTVNLPLDKATDRADVSMGYPNEGWIAVTPRRKCEVAIRLYPWMGTNVTGSVAGQPHEFVREGELAVFRDVPGGATAEIRHNLRLRKVKEFVQGRT
ncbi:MAG: hypothetical protein QGM45_10430, partial [Anaerolineales bacterium]|nr:hypothetical protein [Anaerolineales bacterium]